MSAPARTTPDEEAALAQFARLGLSSPNLARGLGPDVTRLVADFGGASVSHALAGVNRALQTATQHQPRSQHVRGLTQQQEQQWEKAIIERMQTVADYLKTNEARRVALSYAAAFMLVDYSLPERDKIENVLFFCRPTGKAAKLLVLAWNAFVGPTVAADTRRFFEALSYEPEVRHALDVAPEVGGCALLLVLELVDQFRKNRDDPSRAHALAKTIEAAYRSFEGKAAAVLLLHLLNGLDDGGKERVWLHALYGRPEGSRDERTYWLFEERVRADVRRLRDEFEPEIRAWLATHPDKADRKDLYYALADPFESVLGRDAFRAWCAQFGLSHPALL